MSTSKKYLVGLTGGIGSGKSTVATLFRKRGIDVIDLDQVGRDIYQIIPGLVENLEKVTGISLRGPNQTFDKSLLRDCIFKDSQKKKSVEQLLHPLILDEFQKRAALAKSKIVICEAALLIEAEYSRSFQELVVVMAPHEVRTKRVMARDKISEEAVLKIMKSQVTDETRTQKATHLIENNGDQKTLETQIEMLVERWKTIS